MEYAIGVVTYNRPEATRDVLQGLLAQTRQPDEVFVVDDSDDDATQAVVDELAPGIEDRGTSFQYHRRPDGDSMPGARNLVVDEATSDVIAFVDDDTVLPDTYVETLADAYDRFPDAAGVGGPALKSTPDLEVEPSVTRADERLNVVDEYGEVVDHSHRWIPPDPVEVDVFRGANMSFRTDALREVGGFDVDYRGTAAFEEWDLMTRIRHAGGTLLYVPALRLHHVESAAGGARDGSDDGPPPSYWFARNSVLFRWKNFHGAFRRSLLRLLVRRTGQLPPAWLRLLRLATGSTAEAYWLKGYFDGVREAARRRVGA